MPVLPTSRGLVAAFAVFVAVSSAACQGAPPAGNLNANDACNDASECGPGLVCASGFCKVGAGGPCAAEKPCAAPMLCSDGLCKVPGGGDCAGEKPCVDGERCEDSICRGEIAVACGDELPCRIGLACSNGFCKVAPGGTCSAVSECSAPTTCDDGICRVPVAGACGPGSDCVGGSACVNGVCRVPKGGACEDPSECAPGLTCLDGKCKVPVGGVCASTDDCSGGLACDDDSTCRVPKLGDCAQTDDCAGLLLCSALQCRVAVLGRCAEGDCAAGLSCVGGTCVAGPGGDCPTGLECGPLLTCEDGVCLGGQGADCSAGTCAAGLQCIEGKCVGGTGAPCSRESECLPALVCVDGECRVDLNGACGSGAPCATGYVCDQGHCRVPAQGLCSGDVCVAGTVCDAGFCRAPAGGACSASVPCVAGYTCSEGVCRRSPGQSCAATSECAVGLACVGGQCVSPVGGSCGLGVPCAVGLTCVEGQCRATAGGGCTRNDECAVGLVCTSGRCEAPRGGPCSLSRDCASGLVCVNGACVGGVGSSCTLTTECALALVCDGGTCLGGDGSPCTSDSQCASGFVCLRQACSPPAPPLPPVTSAQIRTDATVQGAANDELGRAYSGGYGEVIATGDFDGDGTGDLAIGAPSSNGSNSNRGRVAIVFGELHQASGRATVLSAVGATDALPSHVTIIEGNAASDYLGASLAATDFNGDGIMDLAIGTPGWDDVASNAGQVAVFYGGAGFPRGQRVTANAAFYGSTAFTGVRIQGGLSSGRFGMSLAAGDANGDRIGDLFVGGDRVDASQTSGSTYGSASLFLGSNNATTRPVRSVLPASQAKVVVFTTSSVGINNPLGSSLALGDADGDGYDDLFVVYDDASQTLGGSSRYGCVFMIRGRPTSALGQVVTVRSSSSFDWINDGGASAVEFVWFGGDTTRGDNQVLAADITGDGRAEVFFSNPDSSSTNTQSDVVWVLKGRADFASAVRAAHGKVFHAASVDGGNAPNGYDWKIKGRQYDAFGWRLAAADVTGDHYKDLVVSAPVSSGSSSSSRPGALYLVAGGPSVIPAAPTVTDFTSSSPTVRVDAASNFRNFGRSVAVGDVNGDGSADFAAASSTTSAGAPYGSADGVISILFGGPVVP